MDITRESIASASHDNLATMLQKLEHHFDREYENKKQLSGSR